MSKDILRQFVVIFTFVFTLVSNGAANTLPLNGRETGEISDSFNVFFVPAGYVFAIWGVIYLAMLAYTVYQSLPAQRANPRLRATGWLFALSNIANGAWIYFWHYGLYELSLVTMFTLLGLLLAIYLRLNIGKVRFSAVEKWTFSIPFSIYLGWITVATIANITAVLSYLGWTGGGISGEAWTVILLIAGLVIAGLMAFTRSDIAYILVLVWAFVGISVRWLGLPVLNFAGFVAAALVLALLVASRLRPSVRLA
jgi:hypothetical protein